MAHCRWFTVMQVQKIFCISSIAFNFPNNDTLTAQLMYITTRLPNPSLNVILDPYISTTSIFAFNTVLYIAIKWSHLKILLILRGTCTYN